MVPRSPCVFLKFLFLTSPTTTTPHPPPTTPTPPSTKGSEGSGVGPESLVLTRYGCSAPWTHFRKLYPRETPTNVSRLPRCQWGCHDLQVVTHLGWEGKSVCFLWDQERKVFLWVWVGGSLEALKNICGSSTSRSSDKERANGPREEWWI